MIKYMPKSVTEFVTETVTSRGCDGGMVVWEGQF